MGAIDEMLNYGGISFECSLNSKRTITYHSCICFHCAFMICIIFRCISQPKKACESQRRANFLMLKFSVDVLFALNGSEY